MSKFSELGVSEPILSVLRTLGYEEPTEIQTKAIPIALSGKDIIASAQTGSGKTAAFALPIIECLKAPSSKPRALIIVPTRELAIQVKTQCEQFAKNSRLRTVTLYGGAGFGNQMHALSRGADIIVATPGRLNDFVERKCVNLSAIKIFVLDEADRLLDMGFMPQIKKIIQEIPKLRQTLMFSATISQQVERAAAMFLTNPVMVRTNGKQVEPSEINQQLFHVNELDKDALLLKLIHEQKMSTVLVFTRTKRRATRVTSFLRTKSVLAEEIHGNVSQYQREKTMQRYRDGAFPVLVATDVAARGLDIPAISHVINYDLPDSPADYVHRIGRTGRAGRSGIALSFASEMQRHLIRDIERTTGTILDPNAPAPRLLASGRSSTARRFRPRRRRA